MTTPRDPAAPPDTTPRPPDAPAYDMSIHSNPDARAWARFFEETRRQNGWPSIPDEGTMLGWFANAMMAMHDHDARVRSSRAGAERGTAPGFGEALSNYDEWAGVDDPGEVRRARNALVEAHEASLSSAREEGRHEAVEAICGLLDAAALAQDDRARSAALMQAAAAVRALARGGSGDG